MSWEQIVLMLRAVSALVWGFVLLRFSSSIIRVLGNRARHYDVLTALFGAVGAMILGYNLRWMVAADSETIYFGLYVFSILLGVTIPVVIASYREAGNG